jgi:4-amino-4-deoxy-L-arabinose transferase-like glycosyltransferase
MNAMSPLQPSQPESSVRVIRHLGERMNDPTWFVRLACIVAAIALLVRLTVLAFFWSTWIWQSGMVHDDWNKLAINWVDSGTFGFSPGEPSVQRTPIFPLFEIPLYLFFGQQYAAWSIALLLFDVCTSVLLMTLGNRLWGPRPALLAGIFYAVYLPIIYYSARIEQFTTVLPFAFLWFYLISAWDLRASRQPHYVGLGLVSGILILSKPVYLPVVLGSAAMLLWLRRKDIDARFTATALTITLLVASLMIAPWAYRNYLVTDGRFIPVQSYFWQAVWQKFVLVELDTREGLRRPPGRMLEEILERRQHLLGSQDTTLTGARKELYAETIFKDEVLARIRTDPASYVRNVLSNIWYFWVGAENLQKMAGMAAMQIPLVGAALVGLYYVIRYRQAYRLRFGFALILILWAEYSLVFGWGRYSLDTVPVLAFAFGIGFDAWLTGRQRALSGSASRKHDVSSTS